MFEFLFNRSDGTVQDILDIITVELNKIQLSLLAQEKAQHMIAAAIAKSPIRISDKSGFCENEMTYRLNVRPNPNQSGYDLWYSAIKKCLSQGEALVVPVSTGFYLAESWDTDNYVMLEKRYRNVNITDGRDTYSLGMSFPASNVIRFTLPDSSKRRIYTKTVLDGYNKTMNAVNTMLTLTSSPAFKFKTGASTVFRDRENPSKPLTLDKVVDRIASKLSEAGIKVIPENEGTSLEYLEFKSNVTAEHLQKLKDDINDLAAEAWDIPKTVFTGTVTEKSDADNEFITYACAPIVRMANDVLNAVIIGQKDYLAGERAGFWMARHKHIDPVEKATNLSQLRGIGFTLDEIFEMVGYPAIHTDFSTSRALTLNYEAEGGEEGGGDGPSDDPADDPHNVTRKQSKHAERRKRRGKEK